MAWLDQMPYHTLSPQRNCFSCFSFYSSFMAWKLFISSLSSNKLLRTSQFKKNQQKILYALVRSMKFRNLKVHYVEKGIPFSEFRGFFEPGILPLARHSHAGRASKGFLTLSIPVSKTEVGSGIPTSDLLSSCTHSESKEISKEQGRIYFSFLKLKQEAKKDPTLIRKNI